MLDFYKKALSLLLGLVVTCALAAYVAIDRTFLELPLLPKGASPLPWHAAIETDQRMGGQSAVTVQDESYSLDAEFTVKDATQYPFASVSLMFHDEEGQRRLVDLSAFDGATFDVKCSPANVLNFTAYTVDDQVTELDDYLTYRGPATFFSCDEQWRSVTLDLTRLEIPQWWLEHFNLKLSMRDYQLDQVPRLMFSSTHQTPMGREARMQITGLTLTGRDWSYLYLLGIFIFLTWSACGIWLFREHNKALIRDLRHKIQKDRPLVAYQQLSVEPRRDKDKGAILRFMATEYANPDLNLDAMVSAIGVSRTKINDILKAELGFTFSGYLKKIRLTEAARLLAETGETSVSEIAYSVGYKNVSYFNKLFKEEYGCTPKSFKGIYEKASSNNTTQ
ncbi:helix-turn-helix domain-containing protein [Marinimicrobium agarilyticum]|uniref:helix-turn-helix domain-containing protein n=1 Tax=Marinimicrobium agarilyticum TaxID=306546 RepID=UPI000411D69A|nr:helix-turn-helix transcriptional regulator [Marinimicrobium agarilyticum]